MERPWIGAHHLQRDVHVGARPLQDGGHRPAHPEDRKRLAEPGGAAVPEAFAGP